MSRLSFIAFAALICAFSLNPQTPQVHVKIRAILVDKDLNQKPVPFLVLKAKNSATGAGAANLADPPLRAPPAQSNHRHLMADRSVSEQVR